MNNIVVNGRLTKDPECKEGKGTKYCSFSIADNINKDDVIFWNCLIYGKSAENLAKYKKKGDTITISGNIITDEYKGETKQTIKVFTLAF